MTHREPRLRTRRKREAASRAVANGNAASLSAWVSAALAEKLRRDEHLEHLASTVADYEAEFGAITASRYEPNDALTERTPWSCVVTQLHPERVREGQVCVTLVLDSGALVALERNERSMWTRLKAAQEDGEVPITRV